METPLRIAAYQFASSNHIADNLNKMRHAAALAKESGARLLVFHECALCGYPPIETAMEEITQSAISAGLQEVSLLANEYGLYIAVGTVRYSNQNERYNAMVLFNDAGKCIGHYDKTALWGWDLDHFRRGNCPDVFEIDGVKIAFRICFDVRFPEVFRELYCDKVDLCIVAFSDTNSDPLPQRYDLIKAHLMTRAMENMVSIVSCNSISRYQTAPTAAFGMNGYVIAEAPRDTEYLLLYDYVRSPITFGAQGMIENNDYFLKKT